MYYSSDIFASVNVIFSKIINVKLSFVLSRSCILCLFMYKNNFVDLTEAVRINTVATCDRGRRVHLVLRGWSLILIKNRDFFCPFHSASIGHSLVAYSLYFH